MSVSIISTLDNAKAYLNDAQQNAGPLPELWEKHMVAPFWAQITQWAPFDQSFKKPRFVQDLAALQEQLAAFSLISLDGLQSEFAAVMKALSQANGGDPMPVFLYPACDSDKTLKERQNGVVGTVVFGTMLISINPLADDYKRWIPFVFAHEYHHNMWGHSQYVVRGGKDVDGSFLEFMITEGQADLFAEKLFPGLVPQWNRPFDEAAEAKLWAQIEPRLSSTDHETHETYMFGNKDKGLPWCMGYSFGRAIVSDYLGEHPGISFSELILTPTMEIFKASRFGA